MEFKSPPKEKHLVSRSLEGVFAEKGRERSVQFDQPGSNEVSRWVGWTLGLHLLISNQNKGRARGQWRGGAGKPVGGTALISLVWGQEPKSLSNNFHLGCFRENKGKCGVFHLMRNLHLA